MFSSHGKLLPPFLTKLRSGVAPFNRSPEGGGPRVLEWTTAAQESFQNAKQLLATAVPLQHSSPTGELFLATDAFYNHIGGIMQQKAGTH
jgi:hypothetical protein